MASAVLALAVGGAAALAIFGNRQASTTVSPMDGSDLVAPALPGPLLVPSTVRDHIHRTSVRDGSAVYVGSSPWIGGMQRHEYVDPATGQKMYSTNWAAPGEDIGIISL